MISKHRQCNFCAKNDIIARLKQEHLGGKKFRVKVKKRITKSQQKKMKKDTKLTE